MAIRVALNHKTHYRYASEVWLSPHVIRLRPAPHCRTPILSYSLKIQPAKHFINWQQDPYSNRLARCVFPEKTREFGFEVDLVAEMTVINPFDFFLEPYAETFPFAYDATLTRELAPYLEKLPASPKFETILAEVRKPPTATVNYLVALNQHVQHLVKYVIRLEPGIQSPAQTLDLGCGSCRDSAWLLVQLLRHLGLAARFVSGYLIQLAPDVRPLDGPQGPEKDFTDLHAWAEVYIPGAGWVGMDATSGLFAGEGHIPLACSADPATAAAVTGFFSPDQESVTTADPESGPATGDSDGDKSNFEYAMTVTRIYEDPRVTKPYTPAQWEAINALGNLVDADLKRGDVRLSMGGEPTFVSVDDPDGPEWNSLALGENKRKLGDELLRRLQTRFAPGGFLHHGQGKWYPGESLPRWAYGLYWRKDGQPIWKNKALFATEDGKRDATDKTAQAFIQELSERLGISGEHITPGYEDTWYYLWKERRLPVNVDPFDKDLAKEEERKRLARIFETGLDKVVGYALPLRREYFQDGSSFWVTGAWFFRPERMYLIPGDSPMGLRLPLESFPWVAPSDFPYLYEQDPWEARGPLPDRQALSRQRSIPVDTGSPSAGYATIGQGVREQWLAGDEGGEFYRSGAFTGGGGGSGGGGSGGGGGRFRGERPERWNEPLTPDQLRRLRSTSPDLPPAYGESASWLVRTALCAEPRNGILHIFMPPQRYLEDYLELVTALEDVAESQNQQILVEGYPPPYDPRVKVMKVTPDPGVIEVNTHPSESWDELVAGTTALYEESHLTRLTAEKFMLDGRHTGTGGGNHIVVGGAAPKDSPLLRRPDLLRSLIGYWHNHPSLSYLFSGMFVGPTSQAPRVDEARNDQVYELELAFKQIPDHANVPPWMIDRILRNLLIDSTGNGHRAEFCIDKLFNPASPTGRLGLLEMRAFEMPPHSQMSLTQQLLLRGLISKFWKQPYHQPLVRWRTEIHDRFMLPHCVGDDLNDVVADLNESGYAFKREWFDPHMEFRFPLYGAIQQHGLELELRQAIEPWHVLGEEGAAGGTVRYVDSSVERLQVMIRGMVDPRHIITVNRIPVPLHPTGANGHYFAGVRYRAWLPASALHPTIPVDSPLIFDVVDTWSGRSIGGCTYYVSHPGGRNFERHPVNSNEAESRRLTRFSKIGHTPGPVTPPPFRISKEFPLTLDLRQYSV
jgi:uncharacterized protein (DUF2126 family)/transglutaminase-like putative cysteine protease